ncbi:MAG: 16S rRNA pseudouridine(516) synthase [Clostridiales bacterium]|nr:16S rRNA pseudouridine(516) synthase [Clostridiales bacterium]
MAETRLDKLISEAAVVSRAQARKLIKDGAVCVDGMIIRSPEKKFCEENCSFTLFGKALGPAGEKYYMLNKPAGLLSATRDNEQKTVLDLFPPELRAKGLFPVGRLDKDTRGLLIITSDGQFSHAVTSPRREVPKRYEAKVEGSLTKDDEESFERGIVLRDGTICLPARLEIDEEDKSHAFVTVFEGKYHQVKRMLASLGKPVLSLRRLSIGSLELDEGLEEGQFRELTAGEREQVFN